MTASFFWAVLCVVAFGVVVCGKECDVDTCKEPQPLELPSATPSPTPPPPPSSPLSASVLFLPIVSTCVLAFIAGMSYILSRVSRVLYELRFTEVTIDANSDAYMWVSSWLMDQMAVADSSKRVQVVIGDDIGAGTVDSWTRYIRSQSKCDIKTDSEKFKVSFRPSPDQTTMLLYTTPDGARHRVFVYHGVKSVGKGEHATELEVLKLTALNPRLQLSGGHAKGVLKAMVEDARDAYLARLKTETQIMFSFPSQWRATQWLTFGSRPKRSIESVHLPDGQMTRLTADIGWFLNNQEWYISRGVPYRRGYLLHGKPGSGKSSLVFALAGMFNLPVCVVDITSKDMNDLALNRVFSTAPKPCILLLEEIDTAFVPVGTKKKFNPFEAFRMQSALETTKLETPGGAGAPPPASTPAAGPVFEPKPGEESKADDGAYTAIMTAACADLKAVAKAKWGRAHATATGAHPMFPAVNDAVRRALLAAREHDAQALLLKCWSHVLEKHGWVAAEEGDGWAALVDGGFEDAFVRRAELLRAAAGSTNVVLNVSAEELADTAKLHGLPDVAALESDLRAAKVWVEADGEETAAGEEGAAPADKPKATPSEPCRENVFTMSFNGLLQVLDGVCAQEGRLVVMTSNHRDRLDDALVRPGRIDVEVEFEDAVPEQAEAMFKRFWPEAAPQYAKLFATRFTTLSTKSMASVQGYLTTFQNQDPMAACDPDNFKAFFGKAGALGGQPGRGVMGMLPKPKLLRSRSSRV